jgi:hypothetical protein
MGRKAGSRAGYADRVLPRPGTTPFNARVAANPRTRSHRAVESGYGSGYTVYEHLRTRTKLRLLLQRNPKLK